MIFSLLGNSGGGLGKTQQGAAKPISLATQKTTEGVSRFLGWLIFA
jgi:hypothetical protein